MNDLPQAINSTGAERRRANVRLAFILLTIAVVFGFGFVAKVVMLGR